MKRYLLYILPALILTACSNDEPTMPPQKDPTPTSTMVLIGSRGDTPAGRWFEGESSRAGIPLESDTIQSIGVYGYNDKVPTGEAQVGVGEVFSNVEMFNLDGKKILEQPWYNPQTFSWFSTNKWVYENPMPWLVSTVAKPVNYKFFAYTPYRPSGAGGVQLEQQSFNGMRYFSFFNIPRFSAEDYMVAENLVCYTSKKIGEGANSWQTMTLRHLHSRIRFCFKLGEEYSELRYIHLKNVTITNLLGQTLTLHMEFKKDADGNYVAPTMSWDRDPQSGVYSEVSLQNENNVEYITLSHENKDVFQPLASLYAFAGDALPTLRIRATYDVYDIHDQLLREDDTAVSVVALDMKSEGSTGSRVLKSGYYYNVNIKIHPAFLYVLSDNDNDYDGYMIIDPSND